MGDRERHQAGHLLVQQLVAAGERIVDVQPKLAARVRLLATKSTNKNDPHDARSVPIAALRSPAPKVVVAEDHSVVMKLWSKRHRDLFRQHNRVASPRLHSLLCDLVPGGVPDEILQQERCFCWPASYRRRVVAVRVKLAEELLEDLCRLDAQISESKKRLAAVVAASGMTTTKVFGVGPVVAAIVVGITGDVSRFATRNRFAAFNETAPIEVSSGWRKTYGCSAGGTVR